MRSGSGILKFHLNYRRRIIGGRAARKQRLDKSEILKFTRRGKIKLSVYLAIYRGRLNDLSQEQKTAATRKQSKIINS